jgi:hypothetical protein
VVGGSSSFSIIESMQQVVVDIRIYLLYLLLMVRGAWVCGVHLSTICRSAWGCGLAATTHMLPQC